MKIILTGGGTAGSVTSLLAIYTEIKQKHPEAEFLFIGTKKGEPEKTLLRGYSIGFKKILCGKLRRYFDFRNITDVILLLIGLVQSIGIIYKFKPSVIFGTGSFVQVPVIWAGWLLRKKAIILQQDVKPSLSNTLTYNFSERIAVTFERSLSNFPVGKTVWTGNPVRQEIFEGDISRAYEVFSLKGGLPVVLIVGGGTGAMSLNTMVNQALPELVKFCQIIHSTGIGKQVSGINHVNYHQYEFIKGEMKHALAAADIVVSRAGLGALTEFSVLGKPVIIIPMADSHQELNADYYGEKNAAIVIRQRNMSPTILINAIKELIGDHEKKMMLIQNIKKIMNPRSNSIIASEIYKIINHEAA